MKDGPILEHSSYDLFYGYSYLNLARNCFHRIVKTKNKLPFMKQLMHNQVTKMDGMINNLKVYLNPEDIRTMEEGMLNEDVNLRLDNIKNLVVDLPEDKQEEIEKYIELQHRIYRQKTK